MEKVEYIILTETWNIMLESIDKINNYLQKETITLEVRVNMFTSLYDFIINLRRPPRKETRNLTTRTYFKE